MIVGAYRYHGRVGLDASTTDTYRSYVLSWRTCAGRWTRPYLRYLSIRWTATTN